MARSSSAGPQVRHRWVVFFVLVDDVFRIHVLLIRQNPFLLESAVLLSFQEHLGKCQTVSSWFPKSKCFRQVRCSPRCFMKRSKASILP